MVTSSWGVPLVPFKLYKVDDGTGEVTVVANNGTHADQGLARPGQGTRQRRRARSAASRVGLHLEQKDIDFKQR